MWKLLTPLKKFSKGTKNIADPLTNKSIKETTPNAVDIVQPNPPGIPRPPALPTRQAEQEDVSLASY